MRRRLLPRRLVLRPSVRTKRGEVVFSSGLVVCVRAGANSALLAGLLVGGRGARQRDLDGDGWRERLVGMDVVRLGAAARKDDEDDGDVVGGCGRSEPRAPSLETEVCEAIGGALRPRRALDGAAARRRR